MRVYLRNLIAGFVAVLLCVVALGMVYPAAVWAISRITPQSADGNLITKESASWALPKSKTG